MPHPCPRVEFARTGWGPAGVVPAEVLFLSVRFCMMPRGVLGVIGRMQVVRVRRVRMMRSRLVISVSVVLRRFGVVVRSLRVMMGCLGVMMRCLL